MDPPTQAMEPGGVARVSPELEGRLLEVPQAYHVASFDWPPQPEPPGRLIARTTRLGYDAAQWR
jgi:hypothetical protein